VTQLYREEYLAPIPEAERGDMLKAYHDRLSSSDKEISLAAAKAWAKWEQVKFHLSVDTVADNASQGWLHHD
jgi:proline iminopeptidase